MKTCIKDASYTDLASMTKLFDTQIAGVQILEKPQEYKTF